MTIIRNPQNPSLIIKAPKGSQEPEAWPAEGLISERGAVQKPREEIGNPIRGLSPRE